MPCGGKLLGERRWQTLSLSRRVCLAGDTKLVDGNWALWPLKRDIVGTIDGQDYQFHSPVKRHKSPNGLGGNNRASVCSDRSLAKS
jgi:hypothetical protein